MSSETKHALLILNIDTPTHLDATHPVQRALRRQQHQKANVVWHIVYMLPPHLSYTYRMDMHDYHQDSLKGIQLCCNAIRLLNTASSHVECSHQSASKIVRQYRKRYDIKIVIGDDSINRYVKFWLQRLFYRIRSALKPRQLHSRSQKNSAQHEYPVKLSKI